MFITYVYGAVCVCVFAREIDLTTVPDQTEAVEVVSEALLLCQLREEKRQKEATGSGVESRKWGSYGTVDGEGLLAGGRAGGGESR